MMIRKAKVFIVISVHLLCGWAQAVTAQVNGPVVSGFGANSCVKYLEIRDNGNQYFFYIAWIQGYLAGMNVADKRKNWAFMPDAPTVTVFIDKYCQENHSNEVWQGATDLYMRLQRSK